VNCVEERMVRKEFLVYDYYYEIPCHKCDEFNPALDYAEYNGTHPFQVGEQIPKEDVIVWMPIYRDEVQPQKFPHQAWGFERILALGGYVEFKRLESLDEFDPISLWDDIAPRWVRNMRDEREFHHNYMILPEVYRLLDAQKDEKILDVACGEGKVARNLAKSGAKITGIDISEMLDYAIEREEKEKLGIKYLNLNASELSSKFGEAFFDKVVCNMALMDIGDYQTTLKQIANVLKEDGLFVFSITHPAFAWPACTSFRVPKGSKRNEDKLRVVLNYFDERPTLVNYGGPLIQFQRPISTYLNELVKNSLVLREMSESRATEELVKKFPRHTYKDYDTYPDFLIIQTMKKSDL
jgi:ubiquinone/menaquinone biosynthesis C-methylase UbiE